MITFSRRELMLGAVAWPCAFALGNSVPASARDTSTALQLTATRRTIEVGGRAATVLGLVDPSGTSGLSFVEGQRFRVDLHNDAGVETIIHWHGQIPPNEQDGVSNTNPMLGSGERRSYDFAPRNGTFWMHSHIPAQEIDMLAAPLIVHSNEDIRADRQEVVLFLHDFSFRSGEEVLAEITSGAAMPHGEVRHGSHVAIPFPRRIFGHHSADPAPMPEAGHGANGAAGSNAPVDLNDFEFDAYLANDRTLDDPEVVRVERGGRVLLRVINAASMTAFWIDLGATPGRLIAIDGDAVEPLEAARFGLVQGQRLDIEVDIPADGSALPVLALREGARQRTGIVLAPSGAAIGRVADLADSPHPAFSSDVSQESALRAVRPLEPRVPDRVHTVMLEGDMMPYRWSINGRLWGDHTPIAALAGERIEMSFHNMSSMAHPMHLHGHVFQVVGVNGRRISGALRDTVSVPQMSTITVAFDAGESAPWMLHCHHMAHMATGMMTELDVRNA